MPGEWRRQLPRSPLGGAPSRLRVGPASLVNCYAAVARSAPLATDRQTPDHVYRHYNCGTFEIIRCCERYLPSVALWDDRPEFGARAKHGNGS